MIQVIHIHAINPVTLDTEVIRVTTAKHYTVGGYTYIPCLIGGTDISTSLFATGTIAGDIEVGTGEVVLTNTGTGPASLDVYENYGFDGQLVERWSIADEHVVIDLNAPDFRGVALNPSPEWDVFKLVIKEELENLNVDLQLAVFTGENEGPTGIEGGENQAGQVKPMSFGECLNVPATLVNDALLIYGTNFDRTGATKRVVYFPHVYDKGGEILWQEDVANLAALQALEPDDGYYVSCKAEGLFRLGTVPKGTVTADVYESVGADSSAANIVQRIFAEAGYTNYSEASLLALNELNACTCQLHANSSNLTVLTCVAMLLDSIGAWMVPDSLGVLQFGRFDLPANSGQESVLTLTVDTIESGTIKKLGTGDDGLNIPASRVILKYNRRNQTLTGDEVLESVDTELKGYFAKEWDTATNEELTSGDIITTNKRLHKLAKPVTFDTQLIGRRHVPLINPDFDVAAVGLSFNRYGGVFGWVYSAGVPTVTGGIITLASSTTLYQDVRVPFGEYVLEVEVDSGINIGSVTFSVYDATTFTEYLSVHTPVIGVNQLSFQLPEGSDELTLRVTINCTACANPTYIEACRIYRREYGLTVEQEAQRRAEIVCVPQYRYSVDLHQRNAEGVRCGDRITLAIPRFGMNEGKDFIVIGRDDNDKDSNTLLDILG